jgi:hypothetical protein
MEDAFNQPPQHPRTGQRPCVRGAVAARLRGTSPHDTQKMSNEPAGQTLQPTALVHEEWLRLLPLDDALESRQAEQVKLR